MNFKRFGTSTLLFLASISFGIIICELAGRFIGLGNPLIYKSDSLVGYRLRPNQSNKRFQNAMVSTDSEGFRIDPFNKNDLSSDVFVFVGDSVTYGGSYIDDSEIFSSIICANRSKSVCLNSGINAWGTYNMGRFIANFSLYSNRVPTEFILVILPGDDERNLKDIRSLPFWTKPPKNPKAINEIINYLFWKNVIPSLRSQKNVDQIDLSKKNIIKYKTIQQSWNDLNNYLKSSISKVNIVITPPKRWLTDLEENKSDIELYNKYLSMISQNPNVSKTCNLYNFIKDDYSKTDYVDSVHLSKSGHKKWAKHINSCLNL